MRTDPASIPGKRVKRTRLVQTDRFAVFVEVEAIILDEDPRGASLGPDAIALLKEVHDHALAGDVEWLQRHGRVYQHVSAA